MAFFTYNQHNSGGSFYTDAARGITECVIVEAADAQEADYRAERIGIYFDDDYSIDCECCGTRWSRAWDNGYEVPSIYGQDVSNGTHKDRFMRWTDVPAYIHYLDGRVVRVEWED